MPIHRREESIRSLQRTPGTSYVSTHLRGPAPLNTALGCMRRVAFTLLIAIGVGLACTFIPVSIAALAGVAPHEAGLASGLINTSQQIGGALGVAVLSTVSTSRTEHLTNRGDSQAEALTSGFSIAFWIAVGFAVAALAATLLMMRRQELATVALEPEG